MTKSDSILFDHDNLISIFKLYSMYCLIKNTVYICIL